MHQPFLAWLDTIIHALYATLQHATLKTTIPGRTSCPTREYYGYLMADYYHSNNNGKVPICVDRNSESVHGSAGFSGGSPSHLAK